MNNHLFAQLERLGDEDLTGEELVEEMNRAKSITAVASQIISNGSLVLQAQKVADNFIDASVKMPKMLEG
nr:hypothetical protein [Sporosarcina sp. E16_8]